MSDDWDDRPDPPPRDPEADRRCVMYADRLLARRPCRWCGQPVRLAVFESPPISLHADGPIAPTAVTNPRWSAFWWNDTTGWTTRVRWDTGRHLERGDELWVTHPCERPEHRPT